MKNLINFILLITTLFISVISNAETFTQLTDNLTTHKNTKIVIEEHKYTHIILIDIWRIYEGMGDNKAVLALPADFLRDSQQIWLQPQMNVTKAHIVEFQQYHPQISPIIFDDNYNVMRKLNVWKSPYHVLIKSGKKVFSGNINELKQFIAKQWQLPKLLENNVVQNEQIEMNSSITPKKLEVIQLKIHKPVVGDSAPSFTAKTLKNEMVSLADKLKTLSNDQQLNIVFIHALCPIPHFPNCKTKLEKLNKLVQQDKSREWIAVINPFYVNEASVKEFADKFALVMPLIFDHNNDIFKRYDVYATPYQVEVDKQGIIHSRGAELH